MIDLINRTNLLNDVNNPNFSGIIFSKVRKRGQAGAAEKIVRLL